MTMVNVFNELFHVVDKVALSEIELMEIGTCSAILNVLIFDWHMWVLKRCFSCSILCHGTLYSSES